MKCIRNSLTNWLTQSNFKRLQHNYRINKRRSLKKSNHPIRTIHWCHWFSSWNVLFESRRWERILFLQVCEDLAFSFKTVTFKWRLYLGVTFLIIDNNIISWSCLRFLSDLDYKLLILKMKLILNFVLGKYGMKNSWSIELQCFVCRHETVF